MLQHVLYKGAKGNIQIVAESFDPKATLAAHEVPAIQNLSDTIVIDGKTVDRTIDGIPVSEYKRLYANGGHAVVLQKIEETCLAKSVFTGISTGKITSQKLDDYNNFGKYITEYDIIGTDGKPMNVNELLDARGQPIHAEAAKKIDIIKRLQSNFDEYFKAASHADIVQLKGLAQSLKNNKGAASIKLLAGVGTVLSIFFMASAAKAAYERGDIAGAEKVIADWAIEEAVSFGAGTVGGAVVAPALLSALASFGLIASGPAGWAIMLGCAILGGIAGSALNLDEYLTRYTNDYDNNGHMDIIDMFTAFVAGVDHDPDKIPEDFSYIVGEIESYRITTDLSIEAVVHNAKTSMAWRYALRELNTIVVMNADYAGRHNQDGSLNYELFPDEYWQDKARMLLLKVEYEKNGLHFTRNHFDSDEIEGNWDFIDRNPRLQFKGGELTIDGNGLSLVNHKVIFGTDGTDRIYGKSEADRLYGAGGNDIIDGGAGADKMYGGNGNDTYIVDDIDDEAIELEDQGYDKVESRVDFKLGEHIEELLLTGEKDINGEGNDLDNRIIGNSGSNKLIGNGGDDFLNGEGGKDFLEGGAGFDTYMADQYDVITDSDGKGRVYLDFRLLKGGERDINKDPEYTYYNGSRKYYWEGKDLIVDDGLIIKNFKNGDLGIKLTIGDDEEVFSQWNDTSDIKAAAFDLLNALTINSSELSENSNKNLIIGAGFNLYRHPRLLNAVLVGLGFSKEIAYKIKPYYQLSGKERDEYNIIQEIYSIVSKHASLEESVNKLNGQMAQFAALYPGKPDVFSLPESVWQETFYLFWEMETQTHSNDTVQYTDYYVDKVCETAERTGYPIPDTFKNTKEMAVICLLYMDGKLISLGPNVKTLFQLIGENDRAGIWYHLRFVMNYGNTLEEQQYFPLKAEQFGLFKDMDNVSYWEAVDVYTFLRSTSRLASILKNEQLESFQTGAVGGKNHTLETMLNKARDAVMSVLKNSMDFEFANDWFDGNELRSTNIVLNMRNDQYVQTENAINGDALFWGQTRENESSKFSFAHNKGNHVLIGGEGNDVLTAGTGHDFLYGGWGNDILYGGNGNDHLFGNDLIDGWAGNDYLIGGVGSDVYFFEQGWGQDTIHNYAMHEAGDWDVIRFGVGISVHEITVSRSETNPDFMVLSLKGTTDSITVRYQFYQEGTSKYALNGVEFAEGVFWTAEQLKTMASVAPESVIHGTEADNVLSGTSGDEVMFGYLGHDTLNGGAGKDILYGGEGHDRLNGEAGHDWLEGGYGNDYLVGGTGSDVYFFERGWGQDTIHNYAVHETGDRDVIRFGAGISTRDITVSRSVTDPDFMVLSLKGTTDSITVRYQFYQEGKSRYALNAVEFADGTVWTAAQLQERVQVNPANAAGLLQDSESILMHTDAMAADPCSAQEVQSLIMAMASFNSLESSDSPWVTDGDNPVQPYLISNHQ